MAAKPTHSVDSFSLLAYLRGEDGAKELKALLDDSETHVAVHRLVLADLFVDFCRVDGPEVAEEAWRHVESTFHVVGEIGNQFLKRAARWRLELKSSYALAIASTLAEEHGAILIVHSQTPSQDILAKEGLQLLLIDTPVAAVDATPATAGDEQRDAAVDATPATAGDEQRDAAVDATPATARDEHLVAAVDATPATAGDEQPDAAADAAAEPLDLGFDSR